MILELDCGNSLIKWRVVRRPDASILAGGVVSGADQLIEALNGLPILALQYCRLVSVRTDDETTQLIERLTLNYPVQVRRAESADSLAGVHNAYEDCQRLGLDRWLAVVGAYSLVSGACLVLDLGTAVTSDMVAEGGKHLGGYICPGLPLMRNQLRTHTRRIRYDDLTAERALESWAPGRSTVEAVERGCGLMLRGFVLTQLELAREHLGVDYQVFLTGGDAALVQEVLPAARVMPDLVFVGLAIACPLP